MRHILVMNQYIQKTKEKPTLKCDFIKEVGKNLFNQDQISMRMEKWGKFLRIFLYCIGDIGKC